MLLDFPPSAPPASPARPARAVGVHDQRRARRQAAPDALDREPATVLAGTTRVGYEPVALDVSEMACGPGRSAENRPIHQGRAADAGAQGQQNRITFSAGGSPEYFRNQRRASVVIGIDGQASGAITSAKSAPSRKCRSPGRLVTREVAVSITPLHPTPMPHTCGLVCCKMRCTKSSGLPECAAKAGENSGPDFRPDLPARL